MKKYLMYFMINVVGVLFTGCAASTHATASNTGIDSQKVNIEIDKKTKIMTVEVELKNPDMQQVKFYNEYITKAQFIVGFEEISRKVETPYFILLNPGVSNIEGNPINNAKDLFSYLFPNERGFSGNSRLLKRNQQTRFLALSLYILPMSEKSDDFIVWSTDKLKKDIQVLREENP